MKIDTKKNDVLKALATFGFNVVREKEHIMLKNAEGKNICIPNHKRVKGSTLSRELTKAGIDKKAFFALV